MGFCPIWKTLFEWNYLHTNGIRKKWRCFDAVLWRVLAVNYIMIMMTVKIDISIQEIFDVHWAKWWRYCWMKKNHFLLKKRHLKSTVILLSSINKYLLLNHLFKVIWKVNIFIISLFSCLIICTLHFSYYCYLLKLCGLKWFGAWVITRHIRFRGSIQVMMSECGRFFFVKDEKKGVSIDVIKFYWEMNIVYIHSVQ